MINADDFGLEQSVNDAIILAFEKGLIDRTTLMTNVPKAVEAMDAAKEKGFADRVGVHLNLTSGRPLTESIASDPVMCNSGGEFTADFARNIRTRFFLPSKTRRNVEAELRAQLDRYGKLGGTLWHIDSHHHVHTDPSVWRILKKVLKDYPVTGVRIGRNMYRGGNPLMHLYKALLNASIRRFCIEKPCYFGSMDDYRNCLAYLPQRPEDKGNVEIMVHPGFDRDRKLVDVTKNEPEPLARPH